MNLLIGFLNVNWKSHSLQLLTIINWSITSGSSIMKNLEKEKTKEVLICNQWKCNKNTYKDNRKWTINKSDPNRLYRIKNKILFTVSKLIKLKFIKSWKKPSSKSLYLNSPI